MTPTGKYAFGPMLPTTAAVTQPPPPIDSPSVPSIQEAAVIKIVDWTAVGWSALEFAFCLVVGVLGLGSAQSLSVILLPGAFISLAVLVHKLIGVTFDPGRGTLRFYSFFLPRELALADIRDANCQFAVTMSPSRLALAICGSAGGGKARRSGGSASQRTYMVNLSGAFGSRQVRFYSKRWRAMSFSACCAIRPPPAASPAGASRGDMFLAALDMQISLFDRKRNERS